VNGRVAVAAGLYAYALLLVARGVPAHWIAFRIPSLDPPFADMLNLTTAWECDRAGRDPLHLNACDPLERPANYPRLWLGLSPLGLDRDWNTALGLAAAGTFLASALWLVPRRLTLDAAIVWVAATTSPAVMLGVERGNPDLIVFALLVVALALLRRGTVRHALGVGVLVLAAMLKLFPAFALGVLLRQRPRVAALTLGIAGAALAVYAAVTLDDLREIREVLPKYVYFSFGAQVGVQALREGLGEADSSAWRLGTGLALAAVALLAAVAAWRRRPTPVESTRALDAYWVGALVYVGSFATAYSWDYRLMFLLLTLPQLLRWSAEARPPVPGAAVAVAAIVATLWLGEWLSAWNAARPFEELLNWALFGYLLYGLLLTLPPWLAARLPRRATAA
jgi:hypothetical protein